MKIAIGSEHAGFGLKELLVTYLQDKGHEVGDLGYQSEEGKKDQDYTHVALAVSQRVIDKEYDLGILICGTGIGMSIAAGKVPGIRAALCTKEFSAKMAREHNNANILCLGAWVTGEKIAYHIVDIFLESDFTAGRHSQRVQNIHEIEKKYSLLP